MKPFSVTAWAGVVPHLGVLAAASIRSHLCLRQGVASKGLSLDVLSQLVHRRQVEENTATWVWHRTVAVGHRAAAQLKRNVHYRMDALASTRVRLLGRQTGLLTMHCVCRCLQVLLIRVSARALNLALR